MLSPGAGQFLGFMQQAFVQATSDNNLRPGAAPRKGKPAGRSGRRLACRGGRHLAARPIRPQLRPPVFPLGRLPNSTPGETPPLHFCGLDIGSEALKESLRVACDIGRSDEGV
jgi:hypothetical protein